MASFHKTVYYNKKNLDLDISKSKDSTFRCQSITIFNFTKAQKD